MANSTGSGAAGAGGQQGEAQGGSSGGYFMLGAFLGAAVGAALGLLYAPRPGRETRIDWERRSEAFRRRAEEAAEKASARSAELAERTRQYAAKAERAASGGHEGSGESVANTEPTVVPDDAQAASPAA